MIAARHLRQPVEALRLAVDVGVLLAHSLAQTASYHRRRWLARRRA